MKAIVNIKRVFLTGVVALTLGLSLVPPVHAASTADCSFVAERTVQPDNDGKKGNDGQETHG